MKIEIVDKKLNQIKSDGEIVFVVDKNLKHKWIKDLKVLKNQGFKGGDGEAIMFNSKNKLYYGISSLDASEIREGAALAIKQFKNSKIKSVKVGLYSQDKESNVQAMAEGFILGSYVFDMYKSKKQSFPLKNIIISTENYSKEIFDTKELIKEIKDGQKIAQATNIVRDVVNQIPSEVTPIKLAEISKELAEKNSLSIKVYGEKYLEKEGMGAMLAVSKASPYPPQLVHMIYKGENTKVKVAVVGKGLTYDTGGLSLKPSDSMATMKLDKAGACAILGIMKAVSDLNLPIELHGIIGAVENAIGKHAYKPDDVVKAKNNKTIEIKNTDAEGRLVLADCLCYTQESNFDYIIDIATLTGACVVALGEYTIGVMGHNKEILEGLVDAGEESGELASVLPFNKHLAKLIKGEVADINNISSSKYGGAITAGLFLSEFVEKKNKNKWAHIDIAGPSFTEKPWGVNSYGGTGSGVRMIVEWLRRLSS